MRAAQAVFAGAPAGIALLTGCAVILFGNVARAARHLRPRR